MPYSVVSQKLEKPDIDDRDYRIVELPNKLQALLIHDPTTDKSAAALDVNAGAFSDPPQLPGLAHFCEHLLFMGTEKYPSENEYSSYLSKNSGYSNAYTSSMHTNYYFEVANSALEGALDRFSQFFICPLFSPSCKDREINAVDSENKKNLENDTWRLYQLSKALSNPHHPYHGFSTGNKVTLGETPAANGLDVRAELLKFHSSHYSSNLMRLVVLSNEPLDTLTDWTVEKFSDVVNKDIERPIYLQSPFAKAGFDGKTLIKAKPITEMRSLEITFPIPDPDPEWQYLPAKYLSHLIGHESEGSLLYYFKEKGWATTLSAGPSNISPGFGEFEIDVDLTTQGLAHYEEIFAHVFEYVTMLQQEGAQKWVFEELQEQSITSFKFRQKYGSSATASKLASVMHSLNYYQVGPLDPKTDLTGTHSSGTIPPEYLLSESIVRKFDPELIDTFTSYLNPSNFKATLVAKEPFENLSDVQNERWYKTEYKVEALPQTLVDHLDKVGRNPALHLPERNRFIPTDFSLAPTAEVLPMYPKLIEADTKSKVWYKVNTKLGGPRSALMFKFNLPGSTTTPLASVYLSLLIELLDDDLNSVSYLASMAGLSHEFDLARDGMSLQINGYSHKLSVLLETLIDRLVKFTSIQSDDVWNDSRRKRFDVIREKMLKNLKNFGYSVPYNQVGPMVSSLINENAWLIDDQLACFDAVTFEGLRNYSTNLFDICFIEALVDGNYTKKEAIQACEVVSSKFAKTVSLTESQFTRGRSLNLPTDQTHHFLKANDDAHNVNSCIEVYMQLGMIPDSRQRVTAEMIAQLLHEPFFNRLRTNEQLGYVVFSGLRETRTTFGLRFLVQSERSTEYLRERILRFIIRMSKTLATMDPEDYQKHVDAVINRKLQKVKNLREERTRFWNRIASGFYDFARREDDVAILKTLTLDEVRQFYEEKVINPKGHGNLVVHLQSQIVPKQTKATIVKSSISNFLYELPEFDELENQTEIDSLVDTKDGDIDQVLSSPEFAKLVPGFKYASELKDYVELELSKDYSKVSTDSTHKIIEQAGEWKCSIPLTTAPTAKILESYLDDSKL